MFLRLNQFIFGGILYAVQSAILIALLYVSACLPFYGFNGILFIVGATALAAAFLSTLISFLFFMGFRFFRKKGDAEKESWLIPLSAAMIVNLWLVMVSLEEAWRWGFVGLNLTVSIGAVLLSRWIYRRVWAKLIVLKSQARSSI